MEVIRIQTLSILCFLALLLGCGPKEPLRKGPPAVPVATARVIEKDHPVYISTIGNVYSFLTVDIRPQVSGQILDIHVQRGDKVKKGQVLYTIDPRPYQAILDKAKATLVKDKASLDFAKKKLVRYEGLVKQDYVSQLNYDQYKTDVSTLEAQIVQDQADIDSAQINLDYCTIRAPMDGMISFYNVDPGNIVSPTQADPLTVLRMLDPASIHFNISQHDYQRLKDAHPEKIVIKAFLPHQENNQLEGDVYFVDNHLELTTGTILLMAKIPNPDGVLWPGEFVNVRVLVTVEKNALMVPISAVEIGQKGSFIYVVKSDMTVEARLVEVGDQDENFAVIRKGVAVDEIVVTDGQINLFPGAKVIIKDASQTKSPG
jgi:multidrug efflux system membrane fusion protein